jgi:hypothetical protein
MGSGGFAVWAASTLEHSAIIWLVAAGCSAVFGAIAGTIAFIMQASKTMMRRLAAIKDGIELYCPQQPACMEFRMALENIVRRDAGIRQQE